MQRLSNIAESLQKYNPFYLYVAGFLLTIKKWDGAGKEVVENVDQGYVSSSELA
jgi:hypothetical protein